MSRLEIRNIEICIKVERFKIYNLASLCGSLSAYMASISFL